VFVISDGDDFGLYGNLADVLADVSLPFLVVDLLKRKHELEISCTHYTHHIQG